MIEHAIRDELAICVVINKVDRLIMELKLPPADAYHKLVHTLKEVNDIIETATDGSVPQRVSPELGNVCFAGAIHGWSFTLLSFAKVQSMTRACMGGVCVSGLGQLIMCVCLDPTTTSCTRTGTRAES